MTADMMQSGPSAIARIIRRRLRKIGRFKYRGLNLEMLEQLPLAGAPPGVVEAIQLCRAISDPVSGDQ
jgi:hypothetical protein